MIYTKYNPITERVQMTIDRKQFDQLTHILTNYAKLGVNELLPETEEIRTVLEATRLSITFSDALLNKETAA